MEGKAAVGHDPKIHNHHHHHHSPHQHHHHHRDKAWKNRHRAERVLRRFIDIKLSTALQAWKTAIYSAKELQEKAAFKQQTQHVLNLLTISKPHQRSADEINQLICWLPAMYPQLFKCKENKDRLMPSIRSSMLGAAGTMSDSDMELLAQSIRLVNFPSEHVIFEQGMLGDAMYCILSGEVSVSVHDFDVHKRTTTLEMMTLQQHKRSFGKLVAILARSDIVGELALSNASGERSATIKTLRPCTMIEITKKVFFLCFASIRASIRSRLKCIDFLQRLVFFSDWKNQRLQHLLYPMQEKTYRRGSVLVRQDEKSDGMYCVINGNVILEFDSNGTKFNTGIVGEGGIFGFESFVHCDLNARCAETVVCSTSTVAVLFLPRSEYGQMMERFNGTHTRSRMENMINARKRARERCLRNRLKLLKNKNLGKIWRSHAGGKTGSSKMRVSTPDSQVIGARTKLRLSLLPETQRNRSCLKRKVLSGTSIAKKTIPSSTVMSTVKDFETSIILSDMDQKRINATQKKMRAAPMPCHRFSLLHHVSDVTEKLQKLQARRPARSCQRGIDVERSKYIVEKRARWLKASRVAKKNSRRKRRKAPGLDSFDHRFDRPIFAHGKLEGTIVMR